jgi:hypothetical protein
VQIFYLILFVFRHVYRDSVGSACRLVLVALDGSGVALSSDCHGGLIMCKEFALDAVLNSVNSAKSIPSSSHCEMGSTNDCPQSHVATL